MYVCVCIFTESITVFFCCNTKINFSYAGAKLTSMNQGQLNNTNLKS